MVVVLMVFFMCGELVLVLWGVCLILRNGYGILGQNYVALLQKSEMSSGLHSRNIVLGMHCCRITTVIVDKWPND